MVRRIVGFMRIGIIAIALILLVTLFAVSPADLGPFGITAWFTLLLLMGAMSFTLLIYRFKNNFSTEGFVTALRRGFLSSVWLTALLALGSLRQLTVRDIILLTVLVIVMDFYIRRIQA